MKTEVIITGPIENSCQSVRDMKSGDFAITDNGNWGPVLVTLTGFDRKYLAIVGSETGNGWSSPSPDMKVRICKKVNISWE